MIPGGSTPLRNRGKCRSPQDMNSFRQIFTDFLPLVVSLVTAYFAFIKGEETEKEKARATTIETAIKLAPLLTSAEASNRALGHALLKVMKQDDVSASIRASALTASSVAIVSWNGRCTEQVALIKKQLGIDTVHHGIEQNPARFEGVNYITVRYSQSDDEPYAESISTMIPGSIYAYTPRKNSKRRAFEVWLPRQCDWAYSFDFEYGSTDTYEYGSTSKTQPHIVDK